MLRLFVLRIFQFVVFFLSVVFAMLWFMLYYNVSVYISLTLPICWFYFHNLYVNLAGKGHIFLEPLVGSQHLAFRSKYYPLSLIAKLYRLIIIQSRLG